MGISYEADAIKTDENLQLNEKMTSLDIIQSEDDSAMEVRKLAEEMQQRCQALHNELQQFHEYLQGQVRCIVSSSSRYFEGVGLRWIYHTNVWLGTETREVGRVWRVL